MGPEETVQLYWEMVSVVRVVFLPNEDISEYIFVLMCTKLFVYLFLTHCRFEYKDSRILASDQTMTIWKYLPRTA